MTPDLCIYHANCMDGLSAAWVVNRRLGHQAVAAAYGEMPPSDDIIGKNNLIADFSDQADPLEAMSAIATFIVVLDHHKTAGARLKQFVVDQPLSGATFRVIGSQ